MKPFLSLIVVSVSVAIWLTFGLDRSLSANDPAFESTNPIKVLAVKLATINPQPNDKANQKVSWLEGLEVQIENISNKPIQYLVMHVDLPVGQGAGSFVKLPLAYGLAFDIDSKSATVEAFRPGGKLNLQASNAACESVREQLAANGSAPSLKDIQPKLHLVIFEDRTAWLAGRLHYPDPTNPKKWIAAEELARGEKPVNEPIGMSFVKASFKPVSSSQTCFRYAGFTWEPCCGSLYVGDVQFLEDPTGNVHPRIVQACCSESQGGGCCNYKEVALGCAP